jgi:hypothetical protein
MFQVDIYELKIGDRFMEDAYPEIYVVTGFDVIDGVRVVLAKDLETGIECDWGYHPTLGVAYAPCIIKL